MLAGFRINRTTGDRAGGRPRVRACRDTECVRWTAFGTVSTLGWANETNRRARRERPKEFDRRRMA